MESLRHPVVGASVVFLCSLIHPVACVAADSMDLSFTMAQVPEYTISAAATIFVAGLALLRLMNFVRYWALARRLHGCIPYAVDAWFSSLGIYKSLPELYRTKVLRDMCLIEQQYADHPYHGPHHAADVVGKCGAMLRRDKTKMRRWMRKRMCKSMLGFVTQRQHALFDLAVIIAAAFHDAGHPGLGNGYLANSQDQRFKECNYTAEKWSEQWFRFEFMQQQTFLNDLPASDRDFVVDVASYAVLRTDMRVHQQVIDMADSDESNPLKRLAALLLHAADLANGACIWSISRLWARWCHQEFHSQGDTSRRDHPELTVPAFCDRSQADVPQAQLDFIVKIVEPTFLALEGVCPKTAAWGLRGCAANAAECRVIMQQQSQEQQALPRML